jgi:hypothetical protein
MGGEHAPLLAPDAAARILARIDGFAPEDTGTFVNLDGQPLPW